MKTFALLFAGSALCGCAVATPSPDLAAIRRPAVAAQVRATGYTSALVSGDNYELKYSGPWAGSRDALEGRLLYRAALLAKQHGGSSFRFLHMPGEPPQTGLRFSLWALAAALELSHCRWLATLAPRVG